MVSTVFFWVIQQLIIGENPTLLMFSVFPDILCIWKNLCKNVLQPSDTNYQKIQFPIFIFHPCNKSKLKLKGLGHLSSNCMTPKHYIGIRNNIAGTTLRSYKLVILLQNAAFRKQPLDPPQEDFTGSERVSGTIKMPSSRLCHLPILSSSSESESK